MTLRRKDETSFVEPILDDDRVERLWAGISAHTRRRKMRSRAAVISGLVVLTVGVTAVGLRGRGSTVPEIRADKGAFSLRSVDGAELLDLGDGNIVHASPGARLTVTRAEVASVLVSLEAGSIDVTTDGSDRRSLLVKTALATLEARHAKFDVAVSADRLVIEVISGEIDLRRAGKESERLPAGAHWRSDDHASPSLPVPAPAESIETHARAVPPRTRSDAARLLEEADAARLARDAAGAARLLDELRTRFPSDANAGLAAFEAGRIHLRRADAEHAVDAFRFAVGHAEPAFQEDAEAGLAQALSDAGDRRECAEVRDAYLEHYPLGAHRARVGGLCR